MLAEFFLVSELIAKDDELSKQVENYIQYRCSAVVVIVYKLC